MADNSGPGIGYFLKKYSRPILLLVILIFISIPLIQMMFIWGVWGIFGHIADNLISSTGMNPYLAKALVLVLMVPLFLSLKWAALALSPWRWKTGFAVIACYMLLFYVSMFYLTKEHKFEFATGKAMKYYARTPEGIRYFDAPGFDPKYGIPLKPVDPGVIRSETLKERPPQKIDGATKYFDFATGDPLCWYYEGSDGVVELFDQPGFHPRYHESLTPVTPEIVKKYEKQLEETKRKYNKGKDLPPTKIEGATNYFDYASGESRCWYYESGDGIIELYDKPGFHPRYRESLKPITTEIVKKYEKQLEGLKKNQAQEREKLVLGTPNVSGPQSNYPLPPVEGKRWPWTSTRPVRDDDLNSLSNQELELMRNEIYARHGWIFHRHDLRSYFSSKPWYKPKGDLRDREKINKIVASEMNPIEKLNAKKILEYQKTRKY
jgi:hypothetical protein